MLTLCAYGSTSCPICGHIVLSLGHRYDCQQSLQLDQQTNDRYALLFEIYIFRYDGVVQSILWGIN